VLRPIWQRLPEGRDLPDALAAVSMLQRLGDRAV
jgi:hypothetical protein